jgi:hypothetical protein
VGLLLAGHLDDYLNPAFLSNRGGEDPSDGCRQGIFICGERTKRRVIWRVTILLELGIWFPVTGRRSWNASRKGTRTPRVRESLVVGLTIIEPIPNMSYRKLIAGFQPPHLNSLSVDSDSVGAPQVSDDDFTTLLHHATMVARHPERVETSITGWVPADHNHSTIQHDILTFIEGH